MLPTERGSIRLFRVAGINVYLHWSWFIIAYIEIQRRRTGYSSLAWNALEYLSLFLIVLLHEFGHALACRQVGGKADQIVLWPLGGVAYVQPPQRPGAMLWSIAAGPLVNVVLFPIFTILLLLARGAGWEGSDVYQFVSAVWWINTCLLIFNLLPIYPLDGGQILRSLLWFVMGRANSLMVAAIIGFCGVGLLLLLAVAAYAGGWGGPDLWWLMVMLVFIGLNCLTGLVQARLLAKAAKLPRRAGYACPACHQPPIMGAFWVCNRCRSRFDTFQTQATCPVCGQQFPVTQCLDCGEARPPAEWVSPATPAPVTQSQ